MTSAREDLMVQGALRLREGDLDPDFMSLCQETGTVAWDIETSGLDWRSDRIGTCQVAAGGTVAVVKFDGSGAKPAMLSALLGNPEVKKVFHHAPFDLRFMSYQWEAEPKNIACTKVASKILDPQLSASEHSLKALLRRHLDVDISKDQQVSDWAAPQLSAEQIDYAATDVRHLERLLLVLLEKANLLNLADLLRKSFDYLPTRVSLDLRGSGDVFKY